MKRRNLTILLFALLLVVGAFGIFTGRQAQPDDTPDNTSDPTTPPYTLMIYMNGSDLESEFGAATDDLAEMLDSGLRSQNANVLILTGGAKRWQNTAIPENECVIWQLSDGNINELKSMGKVNMGSPDTLRDFITYSMCNFPAEKYGLIMWDHGGGSIAGFGHDEQFNDASLTLPDMKKAFTEAGLADNKLEFLGFDACLMATVEMAVLASDFARVLIAAEDLEPGEGWDYRFLAAFNDNPRICGFELGEIIVDSFFDFFEALGIADEEILTLSVIDLSNVAPVMAAMGELMAHDLTAASFPSMAKRRAATKTFGEGSPRDNYADMVDIGDMAIQLADKFPREAAAILRALADCVTYNRHNSDVEIFGLSTFYIYGGKSEGGLSLRIYSALGMDTSYTEFLHQFFEKLVTGNNETIQTEYVLWQPLENGNFALAGLSPEAAPNGAASEATVSRAQWPRINDINVALFPISTTQNAARYAIPANVNGQDADIIIITTPEHPDGKILGIRYNSGNVFQKGYDKIEESDIITLYRLEYDFTTPGAERTSLDGATWTKSDQPLTHPITLTWQPAPEGFIQGHRHTDICKCVTYSL
ncbi:MAG: clostripain-related cysteine peptidase [Defluviitaleaceae bacterium]|nr:clostripain-related cysteine peptidase [Defluviitaleaceae bacterium]